MGNKNSKSSSKKGKSGNTRGQPLGSGQQLGSSSSSAISPGQRKNLVQSKGKPRNIAQKERILEVLEQADQRAAYDSNPNIKYQDHATYGKYTSSPDNASNNNSNQTISDGKVSKQKQKDNQKLMQSSVYMSDPASREAQAAESRIKVKQNSSKNLDDRRGRTRDLLFGDALTNGPNNGDDTIARNDSNVSNTGNNNNNDISSRSKSRSKSPGREEDVFIASGGAAAAALNRMEAKKKKPKKMDDRKQRTIDLLHGDALKGDNYYEPQNNNDNNNNDDNGGISGISGNSAIEKKEDEYQSDDNGNEMDATEIAIREAFDAIKDDQAASKLALRIIQDILKGKTNKVNPGKLDPRIVHVFMTLGFDATKMENKQGQMTDYLVCNDNAMSVMRFAEQEIFQLLSFAES